MTGTETDTSQHTGGFRLSITAHHLAEMIEHVRNWHPMEGCGLLATRENQVTHVYPGTNIARSETFYEMDPREVLNAMREIDERGERLGAIFHSHPSTEAWPSPTDKDLIFDPDVYMIIISLAGDEPDVRAFRYDGDVTEVTIDLHEVPSEGATS
jgi:[CysO sulfur-carrier protein]-S-L-cysteine hydrolase